MKRFAFLFLVIIAFASCSNNMNINIVCPTVEQQDGSRALATEQPRFSWQYETTESNVMQQNYRIIVASTAENAQMGIGDLWDSKTVASNQMLNIPMDFPYTF